MHLYIYSDKLLWLNLPLSKKSAAVQMVSSMDLPRCNIIFHYQKVACKMIYSVKQMQTLFLDKLDLE